VLAQVDLPEEDPLLQSTFVCAADVTEGCSADNAMAKLSGEEDRVSVPLEEMPQVFIDAVLAAEDRQFFSHSGIDPIGIARAVYRDLRNEGVRQGGSTITQQYAKNAYLSSERTILRKLKEAVLAVELERELSKEQILERYLNIVYFGRGAYGAEAAARAYYAKSIRDVGLAEAAYLAGLIRAPETADATNDAERATFRRDSVLDGMVRTGAITADERDAAAAVPVTDMVRPRSQRDGMTVLRGKDVGSAYYVEHVRRLLYDRYGAEVVNGGGLRVYTTLDLDLQASAHEAVWGLLDRPDDPAGALVSIDEAGRVVAMVGGRDFEASEVNLALGSLAGGTGRQPGSSFKPIVLATALEQGISLNSRFENEYQKVYPDANAGEDWEVTNYDRGNEGVMDLVDATEISSNTVYADLMLEVGPPSVVEVARKLGIRSELPAVSSLVLGAGEVSVLDMASAYSTFARDGEAIEPITITKVERVSPDGDVEVLETASTKAEQAVSENTAAQVTHALRRVVTGGTGKAADFGGPIAGKTGTTQDYRDAWFVGYTPRLTTAVWMGFPDPDEQGEPRFMRAVRGRDVTGGSFPAQIWRAFMQAATAGQDQGTFTKPQFTGELLGSDLSTTSSTSSTLPVCDEGEDPDEDDCRTTTTTTDPDATTTTTEADEDDEPTTTTAPATTTTSPPTTTTTTAPPPSSTTSTIGIGD